MNLKLTIQYDGTRYDGWQRQGNMGGYGQGQYRPVQPNMGGCTPCDICYGMMCADCCCDCLGSGGCC